MVGQLPQEQQLDFIAALSNWGFDSPLLCVGAADYSEGRYPSPDIQPGGRVRRRCGGCGRLIRLR